MARDDSAFMIGEDARTRNAWVATARFLQASRRRRDAFFPGVDFGEPAWDILLDLYIEQAKGRRVSTHNLCEAAMVPPTTALRWIGAMVDSGSLSRQPDPSDRRRVFISLTPDLLRTVETYLTEETSRLRSLMGELED